MFSTMSISALPKEITSNLWKSGKISDGSRQKGLQYANEGYIHNITCRLCSCYAMANRFITAVAYAFYYLHSSRYANMCGGKTE